jgi:hypothetical protein
MIESVGECGHVPAAHAPASPALLWVPTQMSQASKVAIRMTMVLRVANSTNAKKHKGGNVRGEEGRLRRKDTEGNVCVFGRGMADVMEVESGDAGASAAGLSATAAAAQSENVDILPVPVAGATTGGAGAGASAGQGPETPAKTAQDAVASPAPASAEDSKQKAVKAANFKAQVGAISAGPSQCM